jgi:hypothetical protein
MDTPQKMQKGGRGGLIKMGNVVNVGRPKKKLPEFYDALAEVLDEKKLISIITKLAEQSEQGDIKSMELLFERAFGKVPQVIANNGDHKVLITRRIIGGDSTESSVHETPAEDIF